MLPSETMIWQPEFTDKTLSRKPGAVQYYQVKKVCRTALINPALICLEQFGVSFSKQTLTIANDL
ncbi:hypothetical protein OSL66_22485, partial [Escherichia coli]|nr:hypothetical protein [Escherichia coli]MDA6908908.1 hypothetical protein [Escherichia coli]NUM30353.1 hypothetical protein [Escherichia coli]